MMGGVTSGIGAVFGGVGSMTANVTTKFNVWNELARASAHAAAQGGFAVVQGGNFWQGAAAGFVGSLAGSFSQGAGLQGWGMVGVSTAMGGVGAAITGGRAEDILFGMVSGAMVGVLNHMQNENEIRRREIYAKETSEQDNNYNFFYKGNKTDRFLRFAAEYIDDGGVGSNTIVINAHGNYEKINAPTASGTMRPQELHEYLLSNNKLYQESYIHGKAIIVRIVACNTGNGFAQKFSSYNHHMLVYAPTTKVWNVLGVNIVYPGKYVEFWRGK